MFEIITLFSVQIIRSTIITRSLNMFLFFFFFFQPNPISLSRMTMNFTRNSCVLANGIQRVVSSWWAKFFFLFSSIIHQSYISFFSPHIKYRKNRFDFSQMKRFYKFKLNNPRYSRDLLPSNEQKVLCSDIAIPLPDRTADGCKMILINAGKQWNPKLITSDEILRTTMLLIEIAINEPKTQVQ